MIAAQRSRHGIERRYRRHALARIDRREAIQNVVQAWSEAGDPPKKLLTAAAVLTAAPETAADELGGRKLGFGG